MWLTAADLLMFSIWRVISIYVVHVCECACVTTLSAAENRRIITLAN